MLPISIEDGKFGTKKKAGVNSRQALEVSLIDGDPPPVGTSNIFRYYSELLGSTGAGSGTTNMNVNGSVTPQEFFIGANNDFDTRIMGIIIIVADNAALSHDQFGGIATLANGWDLIMTENGVDTVLVDKAKTTGELVAQSGFAHAFGNDRTVSMLIDWRVGEEAVLVFIPVGDYVPGGIRIGRGSEDRLRSVVNDNLSALTLFNVRAVGYKHFP